jgi:hypothetical protein
LAPTFDEDVLTKGGDDEDGPPDKGLVKHEKDAPNSCHEEGNVVRHLELDVEKVWVVHGI